MDEVGTDDGALNDPLGIDDDDDEAAVAPNATAQDDWATATLSMCYSPTYQVPVLYFNVFSTCLCSSASTPLCSAAIPTDSPLPLSQLAPPCPLPPSSTRPSSTATTANHTPSQQYRPPSMDQRRCLSVTATLLTTLRQP